MPVKLLEGIVRQAQKNQIPLTFLFGKTPVPTKIERLIEASDHAKIVPFALEKAYPDAVLVLDGREPTSFLSLSNGVERNVILRLDKANLKNCGILFEALVGKFRRLSIHLIGVEYFTPADFTAYEKALHNLSESLSELYRGGQAVEVNILSDRMMLTAMRNCDAGVKHFTVAPNGKCYLCPAFYHDDENSFIGAFDDKSGFSARSPVEVGLASAPLCTRCDAYHCKRCVFLNKKTTLEFNVPSEEQCIVAHIERESSRSLLKALGAIEPFRRFPRIAELNYRDPLCLVLDTSLGNGPVNADSTM